MGYRLVVAHRNGDRAACRGTNGDIPARTPTRDTMQLEPNWPTIRRLWSEAFRTSFHFSVASIGPDGSPHVSPIGSVLLLPEPGRAIYFEEFTRRLPEHFDTDPRISILAVRSSAVFWLGALLRGRFSTPPAVRLNGAVGARREATAEELARIRRRFRPLRFTRGHRLLWAQMRTVREIRIHSAEPILLGPMTRGLWGQGSPPPETGA
jgi:uncharacterized protein